MVTIRQLLETGVHFGHQTCNWNPRMDKYIFTARNKIHIIDLEKTVEYIKGAYNYVRDMVAMGNDVLFVCTKKQGSEIVEAEAIRCGMFYVNYRWWGGMLTNFKTIKNSIAHLNELEKMETEGTMDKLTKKEKAKLMKEKMRLNRGLCGIKNMEHLPGLVYAVDIDLESIAIAEARKLKIPVVGLVDTNCNPEFVDKVIPGNDDSIRSIRLITSIITDAVLEGLNLRGSDEAYHSEPAEGAEADAEAGEVPEKIIIEDLNIDEFSGITEDTDKVVEEETTEEETEK
ncbi:MAG: 30S ribosomal protein S2 [Elusimicrobiota bacterium]